MTYSRMENECRILVAEDFQTDGFWFVMDDMPRFEVILPIKTKYEMFGKYKVKMYGIDKFPEEELIVTPGQILTDYDGGEMTYCSRENHLLGEYNGETHMCIYSSWSRNYTLFKTAVRAAMWLFAYHLHLRTGRSIDSYLSH